MSVYSSSAITSSSSPKAVHEIDNFLAAFANFGIDKVRKEGEGREEGREIGIEKGEK